MYAQPIKAIKGSEKHLFRSLRQCAIFLESPYHDVAKALMNGEEYHGWTIERSEVTIEDIVVNHTGPVIGTTPKGMQVRFKSISYASELLQCNPSAIRDSIRTGKTYGKWTWAIDDGSAEAAEPTDVNCSSFVLYRSSASTPKKTEEVKVDEEEVDPYEGREVIAEGVYDESFGPTICPFCNTIVTHIGDDFSGRKHLVRCLAGHDWSVKFGIVKVYK